MTQLGLRSALLSQLHVVHGFSTRNGGVSSHGCESLNFGHATGDSPENVVQNIERYRAWLPTSKPLYSVHQVHGTTVVSVDASLSPDITRTTEADALLSRGVGVLGIRTADCVPILLFETSTSAYAAVHAGWRGVLGGIVGITTSMLAREPMTARQVNAAIGPCIGVCCFEVGEEVASQFESLAPWAVVRRSDWQKPHIDLRGALRMELQSLGVPEAQIDDVGGCTHCQPELYFSHRRDPQTGRMMAAIAGVCP